MKRLPRGKKITFTIPECGVNAFCGPKHVRLAPGRFTTTESDLQKFLAAYPGVEVQSIGDITPEPNHAGLGLPVPQPITVTNGFSGGGAMNCRPKGRN